MIEVGTPEVVNGSLATAIIGLTVAIVKGASRIAFALNGWIAEQRILLTDIRDHTKETRDAIYNPRRRVQVLPPVEENR